MAVGFELGRFGAAHRLAADKGTQLFVGADFISGLVDGGQIECVQKFKGRLKKRMQRVIALGTGDLVENHDISLDENRVERFYPILRRAVGKTVSDGLK